MIWIAVFASTLLVSAVGLTVNVNRVRYERRTAREISALLAIAPSRVPLVPAAPEAAVGALPPPVARYRDLAVGDRAPVRTVRLRHGGTFRMSLTSAPMPIRGEQVFTADPPGFVWTGRIRLAPGVWVDARDMSAFGVGSMRVLLEDTVTIADARGAQLDQGAALRLLAEMPWFPTALFDRRNVTWSPIDSDHARATLRVNGREVSGVFEFGASGLPVGFRAERFNDAGEKRGWGGVYGDFRATSGMHVPFEAEVYWEAPSGRATYAHWFVEEMIFDGS